MPHRYRRGGVKDKSLSKLFPMPAEALRRRLRSGYRFADLKSDLMAGSVVGIVALPLAMALAIASGVPPQHGLYTAIVAGLVISLLGGSSFNVSGPTAAFVVILSPIAAKFGLGGLLMATVMAGALLIFMSAAKLGRLIQFIPHPVTTGFTAGIAVVIAFLQIKDFLGVTVAYPSEHFLERAAALFGALPTLNAPDALVGVMTFATLLVTPRLTRKVPAPLVAILVGALSGVAVTRFWPGASIATIGSRFSYVWNGQTFPGIPRMPPLPVLPWTLPGPGGADLPLTFETFRALAGPAFAIAMLGAIESLLCAVVADGMAGSRHDPDAELLAQGLGNVVAPFFGGIPATAAVARTATNIRYGAKTPLASAAHAVFVLLSVLLLAPYLSLIPMASLAALLFIVAWNMSDAPHFAHMLKVAPRSDVAVLLSCFVLTVVFDMVVAVSVGIVLAAVLFMRRMAEISGVRLRDAGQGHSHGHLPPGTILYEINGPLFFGAAEKATAALGEIASNVRTVLLDMSAVPAMDVTGLVALESAVEKLRGLSVFVILAGLQEQPWALVHRAGLRDEEGKFALRRHFAEGLQIARERR